MQFKNSGNEDEGSQNQNLRSPSLFENIHFMRIEKTESMKTRKSKSRSPTPTPRRTRSQSSLNKRRSRLNILDPDTLHGMKYNSTQVSTIQFSRDNIFIEIESLLK